MRLADARRSLISLFAVTLTTIGACGTEDTQPPTDVAGGRYGGTGGVGSGARAGNGGQARAGAPGSRAGDGGSDEQTGTGATGGAGRSHGGSAAKGGASGAGPSTGGAAGKTGTGAAGGVVGTVNEDGGQAGHAANDDGGQAGDAPNAAAGAGGSAETGAAGAGGDRSGAHEEHAEFVHVARLVGGVQTVSIDRVSGAPSELTSSPTVTDPERHLYAIATEPTRRLLYTADLDGGQLDAYRMASDGSLAKSPDSSVKVGNQPITLAVDGAGPFLYAGTLADASVHIFAIDGATGALDAAIPPFELEQDPAYVAVDPTGHFLYVTLELEAGVRGFAIAPSTGALTELEGSPFAKNLVRTGALAFDPTGSFLFSSGAGLNAFSIEPTSGALTPVEGSPFSLDVASDFFATNLAVDPQGDFLYVTSFLGTNHVTGFKIDHATGALAKVPGSPVTAPSPYSVAVDPAGHFVYVGNDDGETSVFSLHRSDGTLDEIDHSPFPIGGPQPEFAFTTAPGPPAE